MPVGACHGVCKRACCAESDGGMTHPPSHVALPKIDLFTGRVGAHLLSLRSVGLRGVAKKLLLRPQSDFTAASNISCFNTV